MRLLINFDYNPIFFKLQSMQNNKASHNKEILVDLSLYEIFET